MTGAWGPFRPGVPLDEQKAQLRSLRTALRLLTGDRGRAAGFAILRAEISGGDEQLLDEAAAAFEALDPIDKRRVLATFATVNFERVA